MSILDSITTPKDKPVIATIISDSGMGKTTLASTFPKPIVIRGEDGLQSIPENIRPHALPLLKYPNELWAQIGALLNDEHDYQTVIIDSVTALERMFVGHIVEGDISSPKSINQALGGYGAGLSAVGAMHQRLRKGCGLLRDIRGMNVVFIGHAGLEEIRPPDQESYMRYGIRLDKKSIAPFIDDSDLVGFIKLETYVKGDKKERKMAISSGDRLLVTYVTASNISKNRYGITDDLKLEIGVNPLIEYIPSLKAQFKALNKKGK